MQITKHERFTGTTHQIKIGLEEDLDALEIAECFKTQYPKEIAVIIRSKIKQIEHQIIIVGLGKWG